MSSPLILDRIRVTILVLQLSRHARPVPLRSPAGPTIEHYCRVGTAALTGENCILYPRVGSYCSDVAKALLYIIENCARPDGVSLQCPECIIGADWPNVEGCWVQCSIWEWRFDYRKRESILPVGTHMRMRSGMCCSSSIRRH